MFIKVKYKIWLTILAACVICSVLMRVIPQIKANKEEKQKNNITYTIQMDTNDQALNSRIANQAISFNNADVTFLNTKIDPDIIITENEGLYEGYEKLDGVLYTPFTLFTNQYLYKGYEDNWLNKSNEHGTDKYSKDIRILLEAIEDGKTWRDLGAVESHIVNLDDSVQLYIPTKYHPSYELLRQYIAVALNNYEPLDDNNVEELTLRADKILAKSKQVELSAFIEDSEVYGLLLAQESLISECSSIFKNYTRGIVYPGKSISMEYYVYAKPEKANGIKELTKSKGFWELFGLRSSYGNNTGEKNIMFDRCFDVVDVFKVNDIKLPACEIPETATETQKATEESTQIETSANETEPLEESEENTDAESSEETISEEESEQETKTENSKSVNKMVILFMVVMFILLVLWIFA